MSIIWTVRDNQGSRYRTAIKIFPRWRIHIFWRGDHDTALHDHPNDFWTLPLRGYWEEVYHPGVGDGIHYVKPFRWHYRRAEYRHRVLGSQHWTDNDMGDFLGGGFVTLVREGPKRRQWFFYPNYINPVYWRDYLYGQKA